MLLKNIDELHAVRKTIAENNDGKSFAEIKANLSRETAPIYAQFPNLRVAK